MGSIVTLGEAMVMFSTTGISPLRYSSTAAISMSGSEATVAIGAKRLGHDATWISRLGYDELGELIRIRMLGEGITVYASRASEPTGVMIKEHPRVQLRRAHYYRAASAASAIAPADLPEGVIEQADVFHSSDITSALSSSAAATLAEAIRRARISGTRVSLDANYRAKLWTASAARIGLLPLLAGVDVFFASLKEAQLLLESSSEDPAKLAEALRAYGPQTVVITRGAMGAWMVNDSGFRYSPAVPTNEIDPFGAGDAFVAGYLSTVLDGRSSSEALERAAAFALLAVASEGDWEGLPDQLELDRVRAADDSIAR